MKRAVGSIGVALVAVAMFLAGSVLLPSRDEGEARPTGALAREDLLLPGTVAGLDSRITALKDRVAQRGPRLAEQQASLALAYLQKARAEADPSSYPLAEEAITSSLTTQPDDNLAATTARAILAGSRHDFHGQVRWARRATEIAPFNSQAWGLIGDGELELGRRHAAVKAYQRSIDLRPDLASFGRVSNAAASSGDTRAAIGAMKRALGFAGTSSENAAWAHWQLAELYIGSSRFDAAERHLDNALSLVPGYSSAVESTVHLAAARGDIPGAIEIMLSLTKDQPLPGNFAFLGELYLLDGDEPAARRAFETADERLDLYMQHAVRPDVDFVTFWADRRIHLDRALTDARTLYRQRRSGAVSDALAWALHANARSAEAARFSREAIRRTPTDAGYRFHAGMIARSLGQRAAARRHLAAALELDPSWSIIESHRARKALATLQRGPGA